MEKSEFSKKELVQQIMECEVDGKVSIEHLGRIIFDDRFPNDLFDGAMNKIIEARNDQSRYNEIILDLKSKYEEIVSIQTEILSLRSVEVDNFQIIYEKESSVTLILHQIEKMETELENIKKRIENRKKM